LLKQVTQRPAFISLLTKWSNKVDSGFSLFIIVVYP